MGKPKGGYPFKPCESTVASSLSLDNCYSEDDGDQIVYPSYKDTGYYRPPEVSELLDSSRDTGDTPGQSNGGLGSSASHTGYWKPSQRGMVESLSTGLTNAHPAEHGAQEIVQGNLFAGLAETAPADGAEDPDENQDTSDELYEELIDRYIAESWHMTPLSVDEGNVDTAGKSCEERARAGLDAFDAAFGVAKEEAEERDSSQNMSQPITGNPRQHQVGWVDAPPPSRLRSTVSALTIYPYPKLTNYSLGRQPGLIMFSKSSVAGIQLISLRV
jgi:hypothetical protein